MNVSNKCSGVKAVARIILHGDLNNFYASVECLLQPELRNKAVAVGGNEEQRHGIVLAKNGLAKARGIKTGEALWQARKKCPGLIVVPPRFELYELFSQRARKIFESYTPLVEPFGIDEAWLDMSGRHMNMEKGRRMADRLRGQIRRELGITLSVGVSDNKVFAKLGSDLKKPDATTVISRENYRQIVWNLPVRALLYVGSATERALAKEGIYTIGALAGASEGRLKALLGKNGAMLWRFANGLDDAAVAAGNQPREVKSIGHGITASRDLENLEDVRQVFYLLAEKVGIRLRQAGLVCQMVQISIRDNRLLSCQRQGRLEEPSCLTGDLAAKALDIFQSAYIWERPLRSLELRAVQLQPPTEARQLRLFDDSAEREKAEKLERTLDDLRRRFGYQCIQRAILYQDPELIHFNPEGEQGSSFKSLP